MAIAAYAMRSFRTGRDLYAIGSNPEAARLAGVPVGSRVFLAFVLSGGDRRASPACSGSRSTARSTRSPAQGYEFQVIAAVVVGGVAIFGGSGTVVGAALGALLLNTIDSALVVINFGGVTLSSAGRRPSPARCCLGAIAFDRLISIRVQPALSTRRRRRG